ncbi:MAG: hypothetical protein ACKKL5_02245 [Candidatus Komeilibacteria bacterium]
MKKISLFFLLTIKLIAANWQLTDTRIVFSVQPQPMPIYRGEIMTCWQYRLPADGYIWFSGHDWNYQLSAGLISADKQYGAVALGIATRQPNHSGLALFVYDTDFYIKYTLQVISMFDSYPWYHFDAFVRLWSTNFYFGYDYETNYASDIQLSWQWHGLKLTTGYGIERKVISYGISFATF